MGADSTDCCQAGSENMCQIRNIKWSLSFNLEIVQLCELQLTVSPPDKMTSRIHARIRLPKKYFRPFLCQKKETLPNTKMTFLGVKDFSERKRR